METPYSTGKLWFGNYSFELLSLDLSKVIVVAYKCFLKDKLKINYIPCYLETLKIFYSRGGGSFHYMFHHGLGRKPHTDHNSLRNFVKHFQVGAHLLLSFNSWFGLLNMFSVREDNIFQN